jgi:hypothetical protein
MIGKAINIFQPDPTSTTVGYRSKALICKASQVCLSSIRYSTHGCKIAMLRSSVHDIVVASAVSSLARRSILSLPKEPLEAIV